MRNKRTGDVRLSQLKLPVGGLDHIWFRWCDWCELPRLPNRFLRSYRFLIDWIAANAHLINGESVATFPDRFRGPLDCPPATQGLGNWRLTISSRKKNCCFDWLIINSEDRCILICFWNQVYVTLFSRQFVLVDVCAVKSRFYGTQLATEVWTSFKNGERLKREITSGEINKIFLRPPTLT